MAGGGGRQLRLLLWKDYLTRKRMAVTLFGIIWASGIMFAMYMVRINVNNQDFPTCQFPARALPSAGMLPFLQSFICSVGNECSPLDEFEEIPGYQNAKFTQIRRQLSPLLNDTVLELASTVPDAVKILATLSDVADEPSFRDFALKGLKVKDLFKDPSRVKRYVTSQLQLNDDVTQSLMTSDVSLQGLFKGSPDRCSPESISQTLVVKNKEHLKIIVERLCDLTNEELQKIFMDLVYEIDFSKYINMLGNMYYKLSGDNRITRLGDFLTALLRMTKLHHFLPPEVTGLFLGMKTDFSYLDLDMIPKFLDQFRLTFGDTEEFKSLTEVADVAVVVVRYINKIFGHNDVSNDITEVDVNNHGSKVIDGFDRITKVIDNAMNALEIMNEEQNHIDPYNVLTRLSKFFYKFLPKDKKHDVLFYSTLLAKLMESAHQVIKTNMHIEERAYNVTLRHPQAVKVLKELPPNIVGKTFDALVSAERTQILTSKLNFPGQMFCDLGKLQNFFLISKAEVEPIKEILCTDAWKNFATDIISSFGISDVRENINSMASLLIQETLGKDTSSQLYNIDQDFEILKNFISDLVTMEAEEKPVLDWKKVLEVNEESELMKIVKGKAHMAKLILISVHGALAKEIVKQNAILQYKITPILLDALTMITAFNEQLGTIPTNVTEEIKKNYGNIVKTILLTAVHEEKTYKSLSTYCEDMLCNGGENAAKYLNFPGDVDDDELAMALCNASMEIEKGMKNDSAVAKAINKIMNTTHTLVEEINWTKLIKSIQKLYVKLDKDYPYLFDYSTYSMDNATQKDVQSLFANAKNFWFSIKNLNRALHLSVKLVFRLLDIMNHGLFNLKSEIWLKIKFAMSTTVGPLSVFDDIIQLVAALLTNSGYTSNLPQITVNSLGEIIPNLPQLIIDAANMIVKDDTDIEPIISIMNTQPAWPCSTTSLSSLLKLSPSSALAVQGLETVMCMDKDLQDQWAVYIDGKQARINRTLKFNTTEYDPHLFLKFSGVVDSLINDTILVKDTLQYVFHDESAQSLKNSVEYAIEVINTTDRNEILRNLLHKIDTVVNSITTSTHLGNSSMNGVWNTYINCFTQPYVDDDCRDIGRAAWKYALRMMSVILDNFADDMTVYFTEVNEPDSNVLQVLGFTKNTPFYMLFDRLPEFASLLLNSYWDFGFMSQIRRASQTQFWDCEAVVTAMVPPPGSAIQMSHVDKVKPYICPSFIYWLSMPRDDNVLFNLVAKPQYFFYSMPVQNATSKFESAFTKATALSEFLDNIASNETNKIKDNLKIDNLEHKLAKVIDKILNYKIKETDPMYIKFSEIYRKQLINNIYLLKVVTITNKIATAVHNMTPEDNGDGNNEEVKKLNADLKIIQKIFKRKSSDAIEIMYDVLTDLFWKDDNSTLIEAIDFACDNINNKSKKIMVDEDRIKLQLCAKNYKVILGKVQNVLEVDYDDTRQSLLDVVEVLKEPEEEVSDIFDFFNSKEQHITSLRRSIRYSYDLSLPIYLKYIQSNLQSYNVIITFLSGGDWWGDMKSLYNGPYGQRFFGYLESGFEIADDFLNNLDGVHLVRLAHDLNRTDSQSFCRPNITLSDYLPDKTRVLSELKVEICSTDQVELFKELPPLKFASQGYEASLEVSKDVDYDSISSDILRSKTNLELLAPGPKEPQVPSWITQDKLKGFRTNVMNLLSKETITKAAFGIMSNTVDAGTLFLNTSYCAVCSQLTSWFKQLNLQLFKKQEYDALLCRLHGMDLDEVYHELKNDFHWDMFIKEVISTRNYTKYELNKSMNEFLRLVKLHLLEDLSAPVTKLADCLARNVSRNDLGNAALVLKVISHTTKLLQAYTPHIQEVEGIKGVPYLQELFTNVAHNLDVYRPLKDYADMKEVLNNIVKNDDLVFLEGADVNLKMARTATNIQDLLKLHANKWKNICEIHDCEAILSVVTQHLNLTRIDSELPSLQSTSYWSFTFVSSILHHLESILSHLHSLTGSISSMDVHGATTMKVEALLDVIVTVLADDTFNVIINSLQGVIEEFHTLLKATPLEGDMEAIAAGLDIFHQLKTYLMDEVDLKLAVSTLFPNPEPVEQGLTTLGINNTNFWSIAAPRIHAGYILLRPVLSPKSSANISRYVCQLESMASVILPGSLDVVTAEDVLAATADQFCGLADDRVKALLPVLLGNLDLNLIMDKVKSHVLTKLYSASQLTPEEGSQVLSRLPRLAGLMPMLQDNVGQVMETLSDEPLFKDLMDFSSVGNLMSSSDFLGHAGVMVCGKPFMTPSNRIIKSIISSKDMTQEPDQEQLNVLPTDFCRSMYKEIISMDGGKIVWSFVKPLIMGRILYTPSHPTVDRIIEKVNSTFSSMVQMANLVHSFASAFPSVKSISDHKQGLEALQHLLAAPGSADLRRMLLGDQGLDVNVDVEAMLDKLGDLKGIGSLLSKASNLLRCINLDRLHGVNNETHLMMEAGRLTRVNEFSAGIVFLNVDQLDDSMTHVEYKIRMDIENAPTTKWMKPYLWTPGPEASFIENMRYFRGLIQIQDMLDKAIIQIAAERSRSKREVAEDDWALYTQQEPYPCYRKDFFQSSLYESQSLLVGLFFALLFTVASAVRFIVADKESGNTMLMSVMGVDLRWHTLSWLISSLVEVSVTMSIVTAILKWGLVLPRTDPTLIFAILMVFAVSVLSFCYLMSKLFTSASFAAVCAGLAYLVTFMPFILILSLEAVMDSSLKLFVCLSMSSSVMYSFLYVSRYEAMGVGARWSDIWYSPNGDDMCIAYAVAMMCVDAALYAVIGYVIDMFFGIKSISSSIIRETTGEQKAGVSIVNVSKIYANSNKLALDNVSMDLHKGQITALLGHNGAGKTTLINILTGMLKPTKGNIIIRSDGGNRLGVCPQKDVLFEYMTAREHIALYAQLMNGLDKGEVREEVDRMLRVLSLGPVQDVPASSLSGGTRRRLCVALAFVARPTLVSLDEPTSGVDPSARRDIWSMIVKLKEDRTILLTTHHLDEAELLSDQIVIMHKGQIHTSGSPIEIKRNLGTGYKLCVTLPDRKEEWYSVDEKTKQIMGLVRDVVKNASVVDVHGSQVEIGLPFYATDGGSNNFRQVCTVLEQQQATIGYKSFTMDCSTLEQVFFEICQRADNKDQTVEDHPSKSASSSSIRSEQALVSAEGVRRGSRRQQFLALMRARWIHHVRNRWLLFMLIALPSLFILVAMAFSTLRPPADNEIVLKLSEQLYPNTTQYLVPYPSMESDKINPMFAQHVMNQLKIDKVYRDWNEKDTPSCQCVDYHQECHIDSNHVNVSKPQLMVTPDVNTLNTWLVNSQEIYLEDRYGGYTSSIQNNRTNLIAWYNNKGFHAMPSYLNALNNAILRAKAGTNKRITVYSHPMKISKEQISKTTVYQHVADAGVSALVFMSYSLISAGSGIYLVSTRKRQEKRLQLLCGVTPVLYWTVALVWDIMIIFVNMLITALLMWSFGFPVFVARNNLPAICILIILYGFACGSLVHLLEKLFSEPSLANMIVFCGNTFLGLSGITLLLILDIISESDKTDNARWILHKIFMLSPQFTLGDGLIEIAKNTIQAQVLFRFGMDTYRDPFSTNLLTLHYCSLIVLWLVFTSLNLAFEYGYLQFIVDRFVPSKVYIETGERITPEPADVAEERRSVANAVADADNTTLLSVSTIGNINRGFVHTEGKNNSVSRAVTSRGVAHMAALGKAYGRTVAVRALSLAVPHGQCIALLGENGAGKSTTFAMLTGETIPTRGHIYLDGKLRDARGLCRGLISYCPQSDAIDPLLTVRETLELYCRLRGITETEQVISNTLDTFELVIYADVCSGALSGGNKRKLCAAIALAARAPLVLLDEPTSGMDPWSRRCVARGVLSARVTSRGVLLSTHALDDARRLADSVALMRRAELVATAPLDRCLTRFGGGYVVSCRSASARSAWSSIRAAAPQATLRVMHDRILHILMPTSFTLEKKELTSHLSDIFRVMSELKSAGVIQDYTVNQSSLDQMFLSFSDKASVSLHSDSNIQEDDCLDSITAL